jgi:acid phosphatase type 7
MRAAVLALLVSVLVALSAGCEPNTLGIHEAIRVGDLTHAPAPRGHYSREIDAACGGSRLTAAGEAAIDRRPYLQQVTHGSAHVLWTTPEPDAPPAMVMVSLPDGTLARSAVAEVDHDATLMRGRQRRAVLAGLAADTIHCYELVSEDGALMVGAGFRTAPAPGSDRPVRFVNLGDLGKRTRDQLAVRAQIARVEHDLVLVNGDVAYDDGKLHELERYFFQVYAAMLGTIPWFPASGNHDYRTDDAEPFRQVFDLPGEGGPAGGLWYSFDWGMVHFVVLDTERVGPKQARWLDADLAASDLPWTIVVGHRPPFSSRRSDAAVRAHLVPVFEAHGVDVVFMGHDHSYERTQPINGVHYIVSGGGGRGVRSVGHAEFTAFALPVAHLVYAVVERDVMHLWAIDATGQEFDTLRIRKRASEREPR